MVHCVQELLFAIIFIQTNIFRSVLHLSSFSWKDNGLFVKLTKNLPDMTYVGVHRYSLNSLFMITIFFPKKKNKKSFSFTIQFLQLFSHISMLSIHVRVYSPNIVELCCDLGKIIPK